MTKNSEYKKSETDGITTFEVTPAEAPKSGCLILVAAPFLLGGLIEYKIKEVPFSLAGFLLLIGFWWLRSALKDHRPKEHQGTASFRVAPDYIEVKGQVIKSSDIHRLILRNAITKDELAGLKVQLASNSAASLGAAIGNSIRAQTEPIANALTLESGGKSTFLAGGMDETTAYGLLQDVSRIVCFKG